MYGTSCGISRYAALMCLFRALFFPLATHNFIRYYNNITEGVNNGIADALSRAQFRRFRRLAENKPTPTPDYPPNPTIGSPTRPSHVISPSTCCMYASGLRHYKAFCNLYDITPWPATETTLRFYCVPAYRGLSHTLITVYLQPMHGSYQTPSARTCIGYTNPLLY